MNDPRTYFSAERTLLAWVRTSISVMGLGFVVARFGLFLRVLGGRHPTGVHWLSLSLGVAFVLIGAVITLHATLQFARFVRGLPAEGVPDSHWPRAAVGSALALVVAGLVLAVYLLI